MSFLKILLNNRKISKLSFSHFRKVMAYFWMTILQTFCWIILLKINSIKASFGFATKLLLEGYNKYFNGLFQIHFVSLHIYFIFTFFTQQPLRAVRVLFSPIVSEWVGGRREKVCPGCISETIRCRMLRLGSDFGYGV